MNCFDFLRIKFFSARAIAAVNVTLKDWAVAKYLQKNHCKKHLSSLVGIRRFVLNGEFLIRLSMPLRACILLKHDNYKVLKQVLGKFLPNTFKRRPVQTDQTCWSNIIQHCLVVLDGV